MTRADIIRRIADAHYQLADLYSQLATDTGSPERLSGPEAAVVPPAAAPASLPPSIDELPFDDALIPDEFREPQGESSVLQGSERLCPIHKAEMKPKPFDPSIYGCTRKGSDPAWTNQKGYCTITSKNVATYLRQRAAVA